MKVKLLVDLTSYDPDFIKDAVGESDMKPYQRDYQPWRTYVNVEINGKSLPVGIDGVECLDERYLKIKQLEKEIREEELVSKLKRAVKVYHVVGPAGGDRGIYLKIKDQSYMDNLAGKSGCAEILELCDKNSIAYERIKIDDFNKLR